MSYFYKVFWYFDKDESDCRNKELRDVRMGSED